ncbi:MAG: hypothetical protein ACFB02_16660 [Mastigocoleus sp.]
MAIKSLIFSRRGLVVSLFISLLFFFGCNLPGFNNSISWKSYTNSRYGFEFPYPANWESLPPPENNDGIVFILPKTKSVRIQGWAGNRLPESISKDEKSTREVNSNFQTRQGVSGNLVVEVGSELSYMTLIIVHEKLHYYWQGRSPSKDFQDYYRLFDYIARRYKINQ